MNKDLEKSKGKSILDSLLDEIPKKDMEKTAERMRLAGRIADLIAEAGYSKKAFADLMGKEPSVITKWLSGTHNFTTDTLKDISIELGIQMVALFEERKPVVTHRKHVTLPAVSSCIFSPLITSECINSYSVPEIWIENTDLFAFSVYFNALESNILDCNKNLNVVHFEDSVLHKAKTVVKENDLIFCENE